MRAFSILILLAASLAPALEAQTTPRRPPADTLRFGATRPAAGDSITMADYDGDEADASAADADADGLASDEAGADAGEDAGRPKPRSGPYARAAGTGPFSVESSGQTAPRPAGGEVVWLGGRGARPESRDTAAGQRVASGASSRRDTAAAAPARRDTPSASAGSTRPGAATGGRTGSTTTTTPASSPAAGGSGARARSHTVAAGETFYGIARRYGVTAAQLRAINPDVEMNTLGVGDVLRLPASARDSRASGAATQTTPRTGSQPASGARRTHTVAAGETLFGIARRYGVTVNAIREANEMETDQVRTGQRLVIPPAG